MHTTEQENHLRDLVAKLARHQGTLSDNQWCLRYRKYVGTPKTWRSRLIDGDFGQVEVPKRIDLLAELLAAIEGGSISEEFFDDMPFYKAFRSGLSRLEAQTATDRRIFCVLGAVGVGKTASCRASLRETLGDWTGPKRLLIIVPEALRENKVGLLGAIASALDCVPPQSGAAAYNESIRRRLCGPEITILFDEAHQGGVMLMRIIKDLVNSTNAKFVYVALRTEYARVVSANKGAIVEAKQFVRRCMQPVFDRYSEGTLVTIGANGSEKAADAAILIARKSGMDMADARRVARERISALRMHGNLSTLSDAIDLALGQADEAGNQITPETLGAAIAEITS